MLRVEASNLPKPRGAPRPRRLLPNPPAPRRVAATSRLEIIPPSDQASPPRTELARPARAPSLERWSVRLELGNDEIAKLYGQGLTRGAAVWKKGMVEWRPLLITPELSGLLRRTRLTFSDALPPPVQRSLASLGDELTLPRPARLPQDLAEKTAEGTPISTVAPTALDVEAPSKSRRTLEFAAVASAGFALAWLSQAGLHPAASSVAPPQIAAAAAPAAAPACATAAAETTLLASTGIPTVSVADLPLAGAKGAAALGGHAVTSKAGARATRTSSGTPRPSRSELAEALSRVAGAASGCGERGGPVRVVVSFASSGVARSIQVSGTDLPAATRSCIIGAASRARVPAFSGDPVTVAKTL